MRNCHWFLWVDLETAGRPQGDGERSAFGVVDVTDRPHAELAEALGRSGQRMYALHADGRH